MKDQALDVAHRIARRIVDRALWRGTECTWEVVVGDRSDAVEGRGYRREIALDGIYRGTSGIGLFLLEAHRATGDLELLRTAAGAFRYAHARAAARDQTDVGFYDGLAGVAYALGRFGAESGDEEFFVAAMDVAGRIAGRHEGWGLDLLSGAAGGLIALIQLDCLLGEHRFHDLAGQMGDHLLERARRGARGWSWGASPVTARDLTGLSHGAAGIAQALLELHFALGDDRYRYAAEQGFAYEREFFDAQQGNWADLRHQTLPGMLDRVAKGLTSLREEAAVTLRYQTRFATAWCHGAPGIALSRLRAFELLGTPLYRDEAQAAVAATKRALTKCSPRTDFSLCHGTAGRCDALLFAASILSDVEAQEIVERVSAAGAKVEIEGSPWICGTAAGATDPSLMLGEAGIGYFYLRVALPRTPSVLLLTTPRSSADAGRRGDQQRSHPFDVELLRESYVAHHFSRILRVISRMDAAIDSASCATSFPAGLHLASPGAELGATFAAVVSRIDSETNEGRRIRLSDAFGPERARFELAPHIPYHCDEVLEDAVRPVISGSMWVSTQATLAPHVRLIHCSWDWDAWLSNETPTSADPPVRPVTFAVFCREGSTHLHRLTPIAAAILDAVESGASLLTFISSVTIDRHARRAGSEWPECVFAQLDLAYAGGLITVRVRPAAGDVGFDASP